MFLLMIITEQKPLLMILEKIRKKSVFIIGCHQCASLCHTGGEPEVLDLKKYIEEKNIPVTGWIILNPACHPLNSKRELKTVKNKINKAENLLVLSCGNGVQVLQGLYPEKNIISGTNTLFLGAEKKRGIFSRECMLCGSCIADEFEGLCPISQCPKQLLNGPCGGSMHGKCEIDSNLDCIWDEIITKKFKQKKQESLLRVVPPRDWTKYRTYNWRNHEKS